MYTVAVPVGVLLRGVICGSKYAVSVVMVVSCTSVLTLSTTQGFSFAHVTPTMLKAASFTSTRWVALLMPQPEKPNSNSARQAAIKKSNTHWGLPSPPGFPSWWG